MVKPKTYNDFTAWFYLQKLMQYYQISESDAEAIFQELKNGCSADGNESGFEIKDEKGNIKKRYNMRCIINDIAYVFASNSNFIVRKVQPAPQISRSSGGYSSSYSGGSSNNNNNNNKNNNNNNNH